MNGNLQKDMISSYYQNIVDSRMIQCVLLLWRMHQSAIYHLTYILNIGANGIHVLDMDECSGVGYIHSQKVHTTVGVMGLQCVLVQLELLRITQMIVYHWQNNLLKSHIIIQMASREHRPQHPQYFLHCMATIKIELKNTLKINLLII